MRLTYDVGGTTVTSPIGFGSSWFRPAGCELPDEISLSIFPFTPKDRPLPYSPSYVDDLFFDESPGASSMANWLYEISTGVGNSGSATQNLVALTGTTTNWDYLSQLFDWYDDPKNTFMMNEVLFNGVLDWYSELYPSDYRIAILNSGTGGGAALGRGTVRIGEREFTKLGPSFRIGLHEVGHEFGLRHASLVHCPNGWVPEDFQAIKWECDIGTYVNWLDPMSGYSQTHYNGYAKWILGLLTGYATVLDFTAPHQETQWLYDSSSAYFNAQQLLALDVDEQENKVLLEYRRPLGFNATAHVSSGDFTVPRAVYIYLRPGVGSTNWGVVQPYLDPHGYTPLMLDPESSDGSEFYDPHRGIHFELLQDQGYRVQVRITRE